MSDLIVAVDGPAGSGKSSVSREAARRLGFAYLDTGAAYRALAWHCLDEGVDLDDAEAIAARVADFDYDIGMSPDRYFVRVGGEDITLDIREPRVSAVVSAVARVPEVRAVLNELFRRLIAQRDEAGVIVEGRDITTVVAPDAEVRILLTAAPEARMARRSAEVSAESAETTARQLAERDAQDSRVVDFMTAAEGVTTLDSTDLDFEQTVQSLIDIVRLRTP
ncbi:MAG: (d)CMP kinase [Microcella sp.]|uniref:(d)CMP kinase n=1 Tax=Microcella sp. TaxID=1913979 RepID=UPI0024C8185D|nr:(d)CMP kinase [Microcella sp.]UYN84489.1 MAG: (d)CMP kinase [Microcella sp.]